MPSESFLKSLIPGLVGLKGMRKIHNYVVVKEVWSFEKEFEMTSMYNEFLKLEINKMWAKFYELEKNKFLGRDYKLNQMKEAFIKFLETQELKIRLIKEFLSENEVQLNKVGKKAYREAFNNYTKILDEMTEIVVEIMENVKLPKADYWINFDIRKSKDWEAFKAFMEEEKKKDISYKRLKKIVYKTLKQLESKLIYLSYNITVTKKHKIFYVDNDGNVEKVYDKDYVEVVYVPDSEVKEELLNL
ncbi:hypothetical protein [Caminibacter pacificus]|uniref:Uncharacterized protein n=1 Tax=Caminibacter pacificus TaxID=1424653 RepID=A0AAJ4UYP2_9BACT|nr:hypothetical protein [Caminibacter pacificus]QCI28341.1 hypothetical protein C6V80_05030 [Caminibacter pacificus]ROR40939.1 hypothetical protein EDC58_0421 [Caminibacter pacificus]